MQSWLSLWFARSFVAFFESLARFLYLPLSEVIFRGPLNLFLYKQILFSAWQASDDTFPAIVEGFSCSSSFPTKERDSHQKSWFPIVPYIKPHFFPYSPTLYVHPTCLPAKNDFSASEGRYQARTRQFLYNHLEGSITQMESHIRIKPKLSFTPNKLKENVYRVRARLGKKTANLPQIQIRETLADSHRAASLSPRKLKPGMVGMFKNAHRIEARETYLLNDKTFKLSKTNESSSPHHSKARDKTIAGPISLAKNTRSMSSQRFPLSTSQHGKVIQRTVSIVIDGKNKDIQNEQDLMDTLSRIILGKDNSQNQEFLIEFLDQSSIHGEEGNFVTMDSGILKRMMQDQEETGEI